MAHSARARARVRSCAFSSGQKLPVARAAWSTCLSEAWTKEPAHCQREESFFRTYSSRTAVPGAASQPPQLP